MFEAYSIASGLYSPVRLIIRAHEYDRGTGAYSFNQRKRPPAGVMGTQSRIFIFYTRFRIFPLYAHPRIFTSYTRLRIMI